MYKHTYTCIHVCEIRIIFKTYIKYHMHSVHCDVRLQINTSFDNFFILFIIIYCNSELNCNSFKSFQIFTQSYIGHIFQYHLLIVDNYYGLISHNPRQM